MFHLCFLNDFFFMSLVDLYSLILFRSFFCLWMHVNVCSNFFSYICVSIHSFSYAIG